MKLFTLILFSCATVHAREPAKSAAPAKPADGHEHAEHAAGSPTSGLKKELIEGLTEKDFIKLGEKEKTVKVLIVATWSDDNYGMNFNGYSKGSAVYTIPKDWTVEVTYINPGPVPHSLIVLEKESVKKIQMPEPYFKGAAVPKHIQGISYGKSTFTFAADEAGEFAFACGFPAHALAGHWIGLEISAEAKVPTLKLGDKAAVEAVKQVSREGCVAPLGLRACLNCLPGVPLVPRCTPAGMERSVGAERDRVIPRYAVVS